MPVVKPNDQGTGANPKRNMIHIYILIERFFFVPM